MSRINDTLNQVESSLDGMTSEQSKAIKGVMSDISPTIDAVIKYLPTMQKQEAKITASIDVSIKEAATIIQKNPTPDMPSVQDIKQQTEFKT